MSIQSIQRSVFLVMLTLCASHILASDKNDAVVASAIEQLGIPAPLLGDGMEISRVIGSGDETPFLKQLINGRPVCRVKLPWYDEYIGSTRGFILPASAVQRGEIEVTLDSQGVNVLKVTIRRDSLRAHEDVRVTVDSAEAQLRNVGENYLGIPSQAPHTDLLKALSSCPVYSGSARQIEAIYVLHSDRFNPPRAVWVVELRGIPPGPVMGPGASQVPLYQRNYRRIIINDETGKVYLSTNIPRPPLDRNDPIKKLLDGLIKESK